MARLIMRRGPSSGTIYPLTAEVINIGRGSKNDIIIHDNEVSREHCRLVRMADDFELQDLNSSNGTFVNGQRVVRNWLLRSGYIIELGDSITLAYERQPSDADGIEETETQEAATLPLESLGYGAFTVVNGPDLGRSYTLVNPLINIGRDLSNDIIIQDPEVSRFHARVRRTNNGYEVEDLGSTNGTQINGDRIHGPTVIGEDDILQLGSGVELRFGLGALVGIPEDRSTAIRHFPHALNGFFSDTSQTALPQLAQLGQQPAQTTMLGTGIDPGALEDHVFLAYARDDWEPVVAELMVGLQDAGVKVWVDQYLSQGAADWRAAVEQALYECWLMVVVMTSRSLASQYVKTAYRYFMNHDKPLIPVLYEPMLTLPVELVRTRAILHDRKNPSRSLHKLVFEVKEMRKHMRP